MHEKTEPQRKELGEMHEKSEAWEMASAKCMKKR